jgi:site-specific recombinase XerD
MLNKFLNEYESKNRASRSLEIVKLNLEDTEKILNKTLENMEKEDIVKLVIYLNKERKFEQGTINIRVSKLIQFYNWLFDETDDIKYRKLIKKLKEYIQKVDSNIRPEDIYTPEDIKKAINVSTLERDRCLVSSLYEGGLRLGELLALTNDMVEMNEQNQEVKFHIPNQPGCKTGSRIVPCLQIYGYVQDWMKCNCTDHFMPLSENGIRKITKNLFKRAQINKPSNPHMFRHSAITYAVSLGTMSTIDISNRFWGIPNSNMLATYLHLSDQMKSDSYRRAMGMGNGNGTTVINPLSMRCVECGDLIQSGSLCKKCEHLKNLSEENDKLHIQNTQHEGDIKQMQQEMEDLKKTMIQMYKNLKEGKTPEDIAGVKIKQK